METYETVCGSADKLARSFVNCTPHPVTFLIPLPGEPDGIEHVTFTVQPSGYTLKASAEERKVASMNVAGNEIEMVKTKFVSSPEGLAELDEIREKHPDALIFGSIISAQAYPGVCALTPSPGYERVPPAQKRMNPFKFTTFKTGW